ncbi:MAG: hypothetical protein R3E84_08580 [Pseudomonadales bacterium]
MRKYLGGARLEVCYEASYVGFSLQRDLQASGYLSAVVSTSSIPLRAGRSVKTDRIDVVDLAEFHADGLLTVIAPPDAEVEQDRDLLRSRQRLIRQQGELLRRNGVNYKVEYASKPHWRTHTGICIIDRVLTLAKYFANGIWKDSPCPSQSTVLGEQLVFER